MGYDRYQFSKGCGRLTISATYGQASLTGWRPSVLHIAQIRVRWKWQKYRQAMILSSWILHPMNHHYSISIAWILCVEENWMLKHIIHQCNLSQPFPLDMGYYWSFDWWILNTEGLWYGDWCLCSFVVGLVLVNLDHIFNVLFTRHMRLSYLQPAGHQWEQNWHHGNSLFSLEAYMD